MFKVEPFPRSVKPTDQFQEWNYWLANFEMAVEKAGTASQRAKATDLSLHIGDEIRRVIVAKDMLPREEAVPVDYQFFDNLKSQLESHFRSLTDESVDVASFNALKQGGSETALEFEMRLRQLAKRVNETNKAMIRTRFIEGLRDSSIRERAFVDGISLEEVVKMATRKEAIAVKNQAEYCPWNDEGRSATVAAVAFKGQQGSSNQRGGQRYSKGRYSDQRRTESAGGSNQGWKGPVRVDAKRCSRCGVTEHRASYCPAEKAICFKCGKVGHFGRMCSTEVRSIDPAETTGKKVENDIFA